MTRTDTSDLTTSPHTDSQPLRILISALGGEGGGTLMNWLVAAARSNGFAVQATSVPGVAQRTGATSYYLEITDTERPAVLNLLPMPGRVDIVLSSELVEAARAIEQGYVSPENTTLIASRSRTYAIAEKIQQDDGRYDTAAIENAAEQMAKRAILVDLQQLANDNQTFISATLYGAIAGSGALPWTAARSRLLLESGSGQSNSKSAPSLAGFDAAVVAVDNLLKQVKPASPVGSQPASADTATAELTAVPDEGSGKLAGLIEHACGVLEAYQDIAYAEQYRERMQRLLAASELYSQSSSHAQAEAASPETVLPETVLSEAARRLANWMAYEDIARVADLKTQPARYAEVRAECEANDDQIIRITEFLKPRAEEIADILPVALGEKVMQRVRLGKRIPFLGLFLGKGRRIPSNAAWGYWLLRLTASMKRSRRRSLRFSEEQVEIEQWLDALCTALPRSPAFALALAELPRVRKGYSDTLVRGLASYRTIYDSIVEPALGNGQEVTSAAALRQAVKASFKDENQKALNETVLKFHPTNSFKRSGENEKSGFGASTGVADA